MVRRVDRSARAYFDGGARWGSVLAVADAVLERYPPSVAPAVDVLDQGDRSPVVLLHVGAGAVRHPLTLARCLLELRRAVGRVGARVVVTTRP